jgi:hypothetical protein
VVELMSVYWRLRAFEKAIEAAPDGGASGGGAGDEAVVMNVTV